MRRKIVPVGQAGAIELTPNELKALGLTVGDQVDVSSAGGIVEITPVDEYEDLSLDELFSIVTARA